MTEESESSHSELSGAEEFRAVGERLASIVNRETWRAAKGNGPERERLARKLHDELRSMWGLRSAPVSFEQLPGRLRGGFNPETGTLRVAQRLLGEDDPVEVLQTLAHENRHDVQARILAGELPHPVGGESGDAEMQKWREAINDYRTADFVAYRYNAIEVDAREVAAGVVSGYWRGVASRKAPGPGRS